MKNNEEILEKAIQKAIDGGWDFDGLIRGDIKSLTIHHDLITGLPEIMVVTLDKWKSYGVTIPLFALIFSNEFATALWGESNWYYTENGEWVSYESNDISQWLIDLPAWQYHLQQMVIADDPIKYLGENI